MNATISGTSVASDGTRHSLSFPLFLGGDRRSQARSQTLTIPCTCPPAFSLMKSISRTAVRHVTDVLTDLATTGSVALQGQWADEDKLPGGLQGQYTPDQLQLLCLSQVLR